jgi:hypothetical protein
MGWFAVDTDSGMILSSGSLGLREGRRFPGRPHEDSSFRLKNNCQFYAGNSAGKLSRCLIRSLRERLAVKRRPRSLSITRVSRGTLRTSLDSKPREGCGDHWRLESLASYYTDRSSTR